MTTSTCTVDGCKRPPFTALHCAMHHARVRRSGEPGPPWSLRDPLPKFAAAVEISAGGCHTWTGGLTTDGYGKFYHDGTESLAHRWSYESAKGPVPNGLQLDHLCRNRACVNPDHLEPVTQQVNTTRGVGFAGQNARKTHCPSGHPYSGDNLYVGPQGSRVCRTCKRAQAAQCRLRRQVAA